MKRDGRSGQQRRSVLQVSHRINWVGALTMHALPSPPPSSLCSSDHATYHHSSSSSARVATHPSVSSSPPPFRLSPLQLLTLILCVSRRTNNFTSRWGVRRG
mmetsp:Transcript_55177/g.107939  ORF Transcript_55177/g.107939 Transcript_55177/m.107939 type:complete len:102 (+) Transcript_55177:1396-1701(+)